MPAARLPNRHHREETDLAIEGVGTLHALLSSHAIYISGDLRTAMTTLTIRNVDTAIKERLRVRAARNGRSMEAELRQILSDTLAPGSSRQPNLAEAIRRRFAPLGGVDLDPPPRVPDGEPPKFDE
jgi:plasmid stability protein